MRPARNSIRPHDFPSERGGLGAESGGATETLRPEPACVQGYDCQKREVLMGESDDPQNGEEVEALAEEEQAEDIVKLPTPNQPTLSEYLDHCVTHYPYRSWCPHCVEGRGREFGHECHKAGPGAVPIVSFDYAFIGDQGEITDQEGFEAAGEGAIKILVVRDSKSKSLFAHVVPSKGIDEKGFAVDSLVQDVKWLGYSKVTLKSDNEPAIVKLLSESLRELRVHGLEQTMEEHSPEYDPQANGSAEVGVRILKGHFRTMRSDLETKLGYRVPVRHPLMTWLVRHSASLVTWCAKGHDGMSAYHRVRSRPFSARLLHFGDACRYNKKES